MSPRTPVPCRHSQGLSGAPAVLEVRGEVYMSHADFAALNRARPPKRGKALCQPAQRRRGIAAPTGRRDHGGAPLRFFAYAWGAGVGTIGQTTQFGAIARLASIGFSDQSADASAMGRGALLDHYREIEAQRATLGYDIDGVVYKVDDLGLQRGLGSALPPPAGPLRTSFPAELAWTGWRPSTFRWAARGAVAGGTADAGDSGGRGRLQRHAAQRRLHCRARFASGDPPDPARASDIRVGDWVQVYRAGDVIPKVADVDLARRPQPTPTLCLSRNLSRMRIGCASARRAIPCAAAPAA
jgi:DNA ligase (NAD+)